MNGTQQRARCVAVVIARESSGESIGAYICSIRVAVNVCCLLVTVSSQPKKTVNVACVYCL